MRTLTRILLIAGLSGLAACEDLDEFDLFDDIDEGASGEGLFPDPEADTGFDRDGFDDPGTFGTDIDDQTSTGGYFGLEPYGAEDTGFGPAGDPRPGYF